MDATCLRHLQPWVRLARDDRRGPWHIRRRRIVDYLLVAILEGRGRFALEGRSFDVSAGSIVWFPPGLMHDMEGFGPRMRVMWAHFDLAFDLQRSPGAPITPPGTDDLRSLRPWLHPPLAVPAIARWQGLLPVANAPAIVAELHRLIVEDLGHRHPLLQAGTVLRLLAVIQQGLSPACRRTVHWAAMQRSAEDIRRAPERPLSLRALAVRAGLSSAHFRSVFTAVHGESPRTMAATARIQQACERMTHWGSPSTMTELADQLGFSTVHSFSRAFKRVMGCSPLAYRRAGPSGGIRSSTS